MRQFWFVVVLFVFAGWGFADAQSAREQVATLNTISQATEQAQTALDGAAETEDISRIRFRLQDMRNELTALRSELDSDLDEVTTNLNALGPKPEDETEPADVAQLRAQYTAERQALADKSLRANALLQRVDTLLERSTDIVRRAFYQRILAHYTPAYFPEPLAVARAQATEKIGEKARYLTDWWTGHSTSGSLQQVVLSWALTGFGVLLLLLVVRDTLADRLWRKLSLAPEDHASRAGIAWMRATVRIALAGISLFLVQRVAIETGLAPRGDTAILNQVLWAVFVFAVVHAVSHAHYAPGKTQWRISKRDDAGAVRGHNFALFAGGLFLIDQVVRAAFGEAMEHSALLRLETAVASIGFAIVLLSYWVKLSAPQSLWRLILMLAAIAPALAVLTGYTPLARYGMENLAQIVVLLAYLSLVRAALKAWTLVAVERLVLGRHARSAETDEANEEDIVGFWTELSVDTLLFIAVLPLILAILGMNWSEIQTLSLALLAGFSIGNLTLSPASLLTALVVALVVLILTRITQRVLDRRVLPMARVNPGLRYSLKTLVGYVGLVIAIVAGVSTVGIDLSSLAIIAGALSVGIGFGLQSIVNNFVSGLILLIERPIKIGDWVITASGEGVVRRINVRSTEIETFDRCSIIVPNSELISSSVQNWTHRDNLARIRVLIGVTYSADTRQVHDILAKAVADYDLLLKTPEPLIYFNDFGDSALLFDVRAFIRDANTTLTAKNELRHRIFEALREADIEIPFPQRVVHTPSERDEKSELAIEAAEPDPKDRA